MTTSGSCTRALTETNAPYCVDEWPVFSEQNINQKCSIIDHCNGRLCYSFVHTTTHSGNIKWKTLTEIIFFPVPPLLILYRT